MPLLVVAGIPVCDCLFESLPSGSPPMRWLRYSCPVLANCLGWSGNFLVWLIYWRG